jgi:hypothetical protein
MQRRRRVMSLTKNPTTTQQRIPMMTLEQIKTAVDAKQHVCWGSADVCWGSSAYHVVKHGSEYMIRYASGSLFPLVRKNGAMDYKPEDFFISKRRYLVEHCIGGVWEDAGWQENDKPLRFASEAKANAAIDALLADVKEAVRLGHMAAEYHRDEYRVSTEYL